jgi:hypothetical protein
MTTQGVVAAAIGSKRKENYKTRAKVEKKVNCINSIDCVGVRLQSAMTYVYIGNKTQLFESDTRKSFLNKLNLQP